LPSARPGAVRSGLHRALDSLNYGNPNGLILITAWNERAAGSPASSLSAAEARQLSYGLPDGVEKLYLIAPGLAQSVASGRAWSGMTPMAQPPSAWPPLAGSRVLPNRSPRGKDFLFRSFGLGGSPGSGSGLPRLPGCLVAASLPEWHTAPAGTVPA
jgi:hypothetical protein